MDRHALLLYVIKKLNDAGSWTGNTHIQKIVDLAQSKTGVEPYKFVIHHYGPYSFDLRGDLDLLVSGGYVERKIDEFGYHYKLTEKGEKYLASSTIDNEVCEVIEKLTKIFGKAPTIVLELIATIDYVHNKLGKEDEDEIVSTVRKIKPHFSEEIVRKALRWWKKNNN